MSKIIKLFKIIQNPLFIMALFKGTAAGVEHEDVLKSLIDNKFRTIVDIGANRGQFALFARKCFPHSKIISFEPLKEPADIFRRVFSADSQAVLHETAIGSNTKNMTIHISHADDSSSLLPISSLQNSLFPGTAEKETRKVKVRSLDEILSSKEITQPALLKIDVQGFEREVLEGCTPLLASFSFIYVECSFVELYVGQSLAYEVILFLAEAGFILNGIYNLSYDRNGVAVQGDFLFENKSLL